MISVLRPSTDGCLQSLLGKHSVLFKEELGQIKGVKVKQDSCGSKGQAIVFQTKTSTICLAS